MQQRVYVGTYTTQGVSSEGIYVCAFDPATARLERLSTFACVNPSFLTLSADRRFLFAVNEVGEFAGVSGGGLSAYALDPASGGLTFLNAQPTYGADPCHVRLDRTGRWAFVANYTGGSLTVLPVGGDGRLGVASAVLQHRGHGFDPKRQAEPHVHSTIADPTHRFVLAADLGLDQVSIYHFDPVTGRLDAHDPPAVETAPGSGPRHMAFNGRFFYVINELNATIAVYDFDAARGGFSEVQTVPTLPADFNGEFTAADLHIAPSGRFLYASNRGYDSLVVFAIDPARGSLSQVQTVTAGIRWPRHFTLDLTSDYLLVANQYGGNVVVFRVDTATGQLAPTGQSIAIPNPVCVQVAEA